ncbi:unnamed protein product [Caenorhabditis sp. 36 PRJEB53466]|nr:unnamed protein product [Caenorhabditis sp. 36 PRJEB53466]
MPTGNSRRGPKSARCPRRATAKPKRDSDASSSCSSSRVRFNSRRGRSSSTSSSSEMSTRNSKRSGSASPSSASSGGAISPAPSSLPSGKLFSAEMSVVAPDMSIKHGDSKQTFTLADKGKLAIITRKDKEMVYMLRCVDGRRVYIEKTAEGACLLLTNARGTVTKAIAAQY